MRLATARRRRPVAAAAAARCLPQAAQPSDPLPSNHLGVFLSTAAAGRLLCSQPACRALLLAPPSCGRQGAHWTTLQHCCRWPTGAPRLVPPARGADTTDWRRSLHSDAAWVLLTRPPVCRLSLEATCQTLRHASQRWFPEVYVRLEVPDPEAAHPLAAWLRRHSACESCCSPDHPLPCCQCLAADAHALLSVPCCRCLAPVL